MSKYSFELKKEVVNSYLNDERQKSSAISEDSSN